MNKKIKMLKDVSKYKKGETYICLGQCADNLIRNKWAVDLGETKERTSVETGVFSKPKPAVKKDEEKK